MSRAIKSFAVARRLAVFLTGFPILLFGGLATAQVGDLQGVHDPVMIKAGDSFYLFHTGFGVPMRQSDDLFNWRSVGPSLATPPKWASDEFPARSTRSFWAPDITYFNGKYHLYYSVSSFGRNRSAIGLATSKSLDPKGSDYGWTDQGKVIETQQGDDWNAIDPNIVLDEKGVPWMSIGSFWSGIKLRQLDPSTGLVSQDDTKLYSIAGRTQSPRAIEAPFIVRRNGHYYLFVSFDKCCSGVNSTYKTLVGRSKAIAGPYVDMDDKPMLEGGATLVLAGYGTIHGPGHCAVLNHEGRDWLVHHYYDGENRGRPRLHIRPIVWDDNGWPLAGEPIAGPLTKSTAPQPVDLVGDWKHAVDFGAETAIQIQPGGRAETPDGPATWTIKDRQLKLQWPDSASRKATVETCFLADDGSSFVGRTQTTNLVVQGRRAAANYPRPEQGDYIIRDFRFRSGETLPELKMHYRTLGQPRRDAQGVVRNAVLIMHGTTGSGGQFDVAGFAGELFGKGQLLDAEKYYIIMPDDVGHGRSSKPSDGLRAKFPAYRYADMIEAEYRLVTEGLKVNHLRLVMGTSMGGMHTWLWGEMYPDFMDALMPLASLPGEISGRNRVWRQIVSDAIRTDPDWKGGDYTEQPRGLRLASQISFFMGDNPVRRYQQAPTGDQAREQLENSVAQAMRTRDANDVLYAYESSRDYNPAPKLEAIQAPLVAVNFADDLINPPELGILEREIKRVKHGKAIVMPLSPETRGHGSHTRAMLWKHYLEELLKETESKGQAEELKK